MALERSMRKAYDSPPQAHPSPTFEQLLRVDETHTLSSSSSPSFSNTQDQDDGKKSVLTKVKEKAKKLKHTLSSKSRRHDSDLIMNEGPLFTSAASNVHVERENDNNIEYKNDELLDEDPEYLGAPMYESEQAPESLRETARQHPRAMPVICENHKTPNCGMTLKADSSIDKQHDGQGIPTTHSWDKNYFLEKLVPGDEEKSLSQAISDAISPVCTAAAPSPSTPDANANVTVVGKVKGAVASLFRPYENDITPRASSTPDGYYQHPIPTPTSSPLIPVSSNAQDVPVEEENQGKIPQAN